MHSLKKLKGSVYRAIKSSWAIEFPFLRPFDASGLEKDSAYVCDQYFDERKVAYFVVIFFDPHMRGLFTLDISVSPSLKDWLLDPPEIYTPTSTNIGTYRIAAFLATQDYWWDIVDVESTLTTHLDTIGSADSAMLHRGWRASSYQEPLEAIVHEAVVDINSKLKEHVFRILSIGDAK